MKRNIWIWNHYATNMFFDKAGRHYWFAENLIKSGYKPTIFCASTNHFSDNNIEMKKKQYTTHSVNNIPFVFINTPKYKGNRIKRVWNMFSFYKGLFVTAKKYIKSNEKPDVILASSVHPLTLVAGIKIARKFDIPCICEVRDLWPESIIAYGLLKRNSAISKLLYKLEKWIYKQAHIVIMTWKGGSQYIKDKGWDNQIDLNKVVHIDNGLVIDDFDKNVRENKINDFDLDDRKYKNLVYAGSIKKVNNIGILLDTAKIIQLKDKYIRFLIYGSGDEKKILEDRCEVENIKNVIFKDRVEKKLVPSILTKSYANILHNTSTCLDKYGQSQNKFFEYLAAGRCIIQTYKTNYSILEKYNSGVCVNNQNPKEIAETIFEVCNNNKKFIQMGMNARENAYNFDFTKLTDKLIKVIENI